MELKNQKQARLASIALNTFMIGFITESILVTEEKFRKKLPIKTFSKNLIFKPLFFAL